MLPATFLPFVGRVVFVTIGLALLFIVDVEATVTRHPSSPPSLAFSFSFFRLIPSSLFLLTSSPSKTSAQGQGQRRERSDTRSNSIGKSHRPSTGPFPPSPSLLSDIVPSEETRFSTNRPPYDCTPHTLFQQHNEFVLTPPTKDTTNNENDNVSPTLSRQTTKMHTPHLTASLPLLAHFPDPIVYQFTLYYPGNMPLIITAGHGGWDTPGLPVKRHMTHRFTPVDLASPISVPAFSTPVEDNTQDKPAVMPWMPERDQTKGGNFKMDVNTHSAALNLAGAVACILNEGREDQLDSSILPKCDFADSDDPDAPPPKMTPRQDTLSQGQEHSSLYYPHVLVFRVPRRFVDVNRNISDENAIADHPVADAAWNEYHDLIDHVQRLVARSSDNEAREASKNNSLGLLLDIHGSFSSFTVFVVVVILYDVHARSFLFLALS